MIDLAIELANYDGVPRGATQPSTARQPIGTHIPNGTSVPLADLQAQGFNTIPPLDIALTDLCIRSWTITEDEIDIINGRTK